MPSAPASNPASAAAARAPVFGVDLHAGAREAAARADAAPLPDADPRSVARSRQAGSRRLSQAQLSGPQDLCVALRPDAVFLGLQRCRPVPGDRALHPRQTLRDCNAPGLVPDTAAPDVPPAKGLTPAIPATPRAARRSFGFGRATPPEKLRKSNFSVEPEPGINRRLSLGSGRLCETGVTRLERPAQGSPRRARPHSHPTL